MRIFSILTALVVSVTLYLMVFEREQVLAFATGEEAETVDGAGEAMAGEASDDVARVAVVALASQAQPIEQLVLVRGRTEAARQVDVRAETSGPVSSEPLRKGTFVEAGDLLCRIDPGTRVVALEESQARLAEARSRVPEAEARLAEATAAVPAAEARVEEAKARVPEARARLAEAEAKIPEAEARLAEAQARVPEAEARMSEAAARVNEAEINLNAAEKLSQGGFASDTRVASVQAAMESALAGLQSAKSQFEGAKAGVEAARSQLETAKAGIQSARSQVESAAAGVITARSQVEGAKAGVQSANSGVEAAQSGIQGAQAAVAAAQKEIDRLAITAPFAGLLESDTTELGALLQPGSLCATIIQLDPIKLVGFVPETEVDKVDPGATAGARLATGREVLGEVTFLSRSADPQTRTFRVEVQVPNADLAIRDGQTVEIGIQAEGRSAHLIPQSALTLDDEGALGVRTVGEDQLAGFVPVTVLRDTTEGIYVSGLPERADIIVVGQEFVTDGVPVAPTYREAGQ